MEEGEGQSFGFILHLLKYFIKDEIFNALLRILYSLEKIEINNL